MSPLEFPAKSLAEVRPLADKLVAAGSSRVVVKSQIHAGDAARELSSPAFKAA
ncbi:MAG: hypothetical protein WDN00_14245 [Limisphaerales bacterium]